MVLQTCILFDFSFSPDLACFVFAGTVSSYNFHWYLTPPATEKTSSKIAWNISNNRLHFYLFIAGLLTAAFFAFRLIADWPWLLLIGLATFLYSAPKINHPFFYPLRKIAIAKTIYLAFVWTLITALLPLLIEYRRLETVHVLFFINRFFFIYAICILFDYRDVESDRSAGIRSLITYFNEKGINRLFWGSILITVLTFIYLAKYFSFLEMLALALPCFILSLLYRRAKKDFSDYLYYFILDGLMMMSAPLVVLAKFAR